MQPSLLCSVGAKRACYHAAFSPQCIDSEARAANYTSSLNLPDKTLQFVKDHPLMDDSVTPIDNRPKLIKTDVNYTQIVVDRTQALDGTFYDVMFISTGGFLGKTGKFTRSFMGRSGISRRPKGLGQHEGISETSLHLGF